MLSKRDLWVMFERCGLSKYHLRSAEMETEYDRLIEQFARAVEATAIERCAQVCEDIKVLADEYATHCSEFARKLASEKPDGSMSPIAVAAGDARMALHLAIDAALAQHGGEE